MHKDKAAKIKQTVAADKKLAKAAPDMADTLRRLVKWSQQDLSSLDDRGEDQLYDIIAEAYTTLKEAGALK